MNGELAQAVALVAHGNPALAGAGQGTELTRFEAANSTFAHVRSVSFEVPTRGRRSHHVGSVSAWVDGLRHASVGHLSLFAGGGSRVAVGFANQGAWGILGRQGRRAHTWYATWTADQDGADSTDATPGTWEVAYRWSRRRRAVPPEPGDLSAAASHLRDALEEAIAFARRHQPVRRFVPRFEEALTLGASPDPEPPRHPDMLPAAGYALEARQLLSMAVAGWVFGGMGSWNDAVFTDADVTAAYQTVSDELYRAVLDGVRDAANSFHAPA